MTYWWLSFADPHKSKGQQFLGVVIVNSEEYTGTYPMPLRAKDNDFARAVQYSHILHLNPGGEVEGYPLTDLRPGELAIIQKWEKQLLTKEQAAEIDNEIEFWRETNGH